MPTFLLLTIVLLFVPRPATAFAGLAEAKKAIEDGEYAAALKILKPLADTGNAEAQAFLGDMYSNGSGVPYDPAFAIKWIGQPPPREMHMRSVLLVRITTQASVSEGMPPQDLSGIECRQTSGIRSACAM